MTPVVLQNRAGQFVTQVVVPTMTRAPEIILWDERYFVRHEGALYREGIVWIATEKET